MKESLDPLKRQALVIDELRRHLLGPAYGDDEVLTDRPDRVYLIGTLFPRTSSSTVDSNRAFVRDPENEDFGKYADEAEMESTNAHFEELLSATSAWQPSSCALSFNHSGDRLQVEVSFARYDSVEDEESVRPLWRRRQIEFETELTATRREALSPDGDAIVRLKTRRTGNGLDLTTVSLSNTLATPSGSKPATEDCLFQCELRVRSFDGDIRPYRSVSDLVPTEEEEELALRYANKAIFAVGHGVAANWHSSVNGRADSVWTEFLPTHSVPTATTATTNESRALDLAFLETIDDDVETVVRELTLFVDSYDEWISDQAALARQASRSPAAANRIVGRQRSASSRMRDSIALLAGEDESSCIARRAFALAMTAMRIQMSGSIEPLPGSIVRWRPFQLGFLLTTLASTFDRQHPDRNLVDLIWFPTGGGKTEAYLALSAFEIFKRRLLFGDRGGGTAVITRYTLRLLTAQQFERAAKLVCALELMRREDVRVRSEWFFTIGLWVGGSTTPNTEEEALKKLEAHQVSGNSESPFQVKRCPWCGTEFKRSTGRQNTHFEAFESGGRLRLRCTDSVCPFFNLLPIGVIDESLYEDPPTVLLATVDKFAQLPFLQRAGRFVGAYPSYEPPSLVIQDELHLLAGPLGSTVGAYETAIEGIIENSSISRPKIIASTATIRAAADQIRGLYGSDAALFPPSGIRDDDSFFSVPDTKRPARLYMGLMPYSFTQARAIVLALGSMLGAHCLFDSESEADRDAYWTVIAYHNSLRELGRTLTYVNDDVRAHLEAKRTSRRVSGELTTVELTGQVPSSELASHFDRLRAPASDKRAVDVVASTNMLSVGIDIDRLAMMLMVGQPKTVSEYIQATSRVGRGDVPGIILTMYKPARARDRSYYESFHGFHQSLYRFVEPTSVTPWTPGSRNRALAAALVSLVRHLDGSKGDAEAGEVTREEIDYAIDMILDRVRAADPDEVERTEAELRDLEDDWLEIAKATKSDKRDLSFSTRSKWQKDALLRTEIGADTSKRWFAMNSMRSVEPEIPLFVHEFPSKESHS